RALELAGAGALRDVTRDRDDVVAPILDQRLHRLVLLGDGGMSEMQIGAVEDRRRHSLAMIASVNWSVVAVPPRSRVTVFPSRIVSSIAERMRCARGSSHRYSSIMHAASI